MITGKCVLVTGAAGSIGSAIVKKLIKQGNVIRAFDQSEDGLFNLEQDLLEHERKDLRPFLGSIRDSQRLQTAFRGADIVFHCAAVKHVYMSEYNPFEAVKTNVIGCQNVIEAAMKQEVGKVILTSSDKSVNPTSTMGATKLLSERIFTSANLYKGSNKTIFSSVRFGNVLNTNGSVLEIFRNQLRNKFPLTITSTEMTRFFISIEQAVDLCLSTANNMIGGEIFVKNMGGCDILTLAKAFSGDNNIKYKEIGLKPGEKLFEELVTETEVLRTIYSDGVYIVLPDILNYFPQLMREKYKKYDSIARIEATVRSDSSALSVFQMREILDSLDTSNT